MPRSPRKQNREASSSTAISSTVNKAISCLSALAALGGTASAAEIAQSVKISRPGAARLLETLVASGVLIWDEGAKRYSFSLRLYEWGALAIPTRRLMPILRREAVKLAAELNRRVDVLVAEFPDVIHVEINELMDGLVVTTPSNHREAWWRTATGKVIAALGSPDLSEGLLAYANESKEAIGQSLPEIMQEIEQIRSEGYGLAMGTYSNTIGVVVPVFDSTEFAVATLTVPATREEFTEANQMIWLNAARNAAARASSQLGSRRRIILGV